MNIQTYDSENRNDLLDEFLTPEPLIEAIFEKVIMPNIASFKPHKILDVGANDGRWGKAARKYFPEAYILGVEIMDMPKPNEYTDWVVGDFITQTTLLDFDLVIGNPPFTVKKETGKINKKGKPIYEIVYEAEDFVRQAFNCLKPTGHLGFLLRSNFRHSIKRHAGLFKEHYPYVTYDLDRRPSFYRGDKRTKYYGKGNTNAHDYAFFHWWMEWKESFGLSKSLVWNY